jgi:hypothetical protein
MPERMTSNMRDSRAAAFAAAAEATRRVASLEPNVDYGPNPGILSS